MPDVTRGSTLSDRYEVIEEIGKGGMGKVYIAFDRGINENIALKIIRTDLHLHLEYVKQLIMLKRYEDAEIQISEAKKSCADDPLVRHLYA